MNNSQKGIVPLMIAGMIAIIAIVAGFLVYRQVHEQKVTDGQAPEINSSGDNNDNPVPDVQSIETGPGPRSEIGGPSLPDGVQKACPAVVFPGSDFCPGGEIMAKVEENCVVGYECQKTGGKASKCDSACKQQGFESGKCVEEIADLAGTGEGAYSQPLKGVAEECFPPAECKCKAAADISCAANDGCLDPGCGECVNYKWSASNNTCNSISDARKICVCEVKKCVAKATCGDKKCEAPYETKFNCQVDCGLAAADKTCKANADCIDDGTACHVCVNSAWLKQNPDWSKYYACDGIGTVSCKCQSGQCAAVE